MGVYNVDMVGNPQFINVEPYNPLISRCEIKVLYLGKNRNGSFIDRSAAEKMANTLPGVPIVAVFNESEEDFGGHGEVITIEDGHISFGCTTRPYGFVAPNAKVWFQDWEEDEVVRTYLMTEGYLWTGQYPEIQSALAGKGQSMELDPEHLDGEWANSDSPNAEFFIINDALFSKLCILGDSTEPCFEGAQVKDKFSYGEFIDTYQLMVEQLKHALEKNPEGGLNMNLNEKVETNSALVEEEVHEEPVTPVETAEEAVVEETFEVSEQTEEPEVEEVAEVLAGESDAEEFSVNESAPTVEESDPSSTNESSFSTEQFELMQAELAELREFKQSIEREKKMAIVDRYHMLSDVDKQPVLDNLDSYSMTDIEKELAYIYVKTYVDFNTVDGQPEGEVEKEEEALTTFSLDNIDNGEAVGDELLEALRSTVNSL